MTDMIVEMNFLELSGPVWSPANDYLAFAARRFSDRSGLDIWLLNLSTFDFQLIVECASSSSPVDSCSSPTWLPDGRLGYVRHVDYAQDSNPLSNIEVLDLDSFKVDIVATDLPIYKGWAPFGEVEQFYYDHYSALSWSPDGSRVAFDGGSKSTNNSSIYVLDTTSGHISQILPSEILVDTPVWLNNTHLLFRNTTRPDFWEEGSHTEAYNIAIVNASSGKVVELTSFTPISAGHNPVISCPFWVPRGIGEQIMSP
jgi:Tol biopolymer transport system component